MCIRDSPGPLGPLGETAGAEQAGLGVRVPWRANALLTGGAALFDPGFFEHRPDRPQERNDVARRLGLARAVLLHAPFEQPELEVDLLPEQALDLRAPAPRVAGERVGQALADPAPALA